MYKKFLPILIFLILGCSPVKKEVSNNDPVLVVLGDGEVFYQEHLLTTGELDNYLKDFKHPVLHIQLERFVSTGDVAEVTEKLRELSIKRITISEKSSFSVLHFEIVGDSKIIINDEVIPLSALASNLKAINTDKKLFTFVTITNEAPMGDVMFAKELIHKNLTNIKYKKNR